MKALKTPRNLLTDFYQSVQAARAAQQRLEEAGLTSDNYHEYGYVDMAACSAGDGFILDVRHAYRDPFDGLLWHNISCYEQTKGME